VPRERVWKPAIAARISLGEARLADFCERWQIASLDLFGSIVRDDFRADSDVDVLVTFQPGADWGLIDHARMEEELAAQFGRRVDLLTRRAVERSANPIRRAAILADAVPLFTTSGSRAPASADSRDRA
jgi:predicted nucleotidyltransferase